MIMKKYILKTKEFASSQKFDTFEELENVLNTIEKVINKRITIQLFENNSLKVSTLYFWNGVNFEMINNNIKTF